MRQGDRVTDGTINGVVLSVFRKMPVKNNAGTVFCVVEEDTTTKLHIMDPAVLSVTVKGIHGGVHKKPQEEQP